ncbi:MAG: GGDEF domain-containing protein [Clostridia bacterium]|nr:GGDEF domain-containing protein [Clostridia bacterium]
MKKHLKNAVPALLLIVGIIAALLNFISDNSARNARQNEEYITELTEQRASSMDTEFAENLTFIRSIAYLYGRSLKSPWADIAVIADYEKNTCFDMLRFVDATGDNYTSKGVRSNLADRDYYQAGMRGESGITYVQESRVTGQRQIGFYAPVSFQDEIIGVMVGFYGEEYLRSRLGFDLFGYQGEGWLIARDGAVLGATQAEIPDNFYTYLRDGDRCTEEELDRLIRSVGDSRSTAFTIRDDDTDVTSYAVCLEICDWVLIRSFPANVARQIQRGSILEGQRLVMILVALFISYTLLVGIRTLMEKRQMQKNLMNANEKAYKDALTRVKNKAAYDEYIDQLERDIQSQAVREFSILVCDINNLKDINDHLGHIEGDRYIREASHLICRYWAHSPVFRIGGDEFAVLIMNADYRDRDRLLEEMRQEIRENMKQGKVAVATGMSVFDPENDKTFTQVFDRADALMYENKSDLKA